MIGNPCGMTWRHISASLMITEKMQVEIDDLLQHITYVDEDKQDIPLDPLPGQIDVVHNATTVELWRGYWAWYQAQSFISLI